jgi:hypothetical protein
MRTTAVTVAAGTFAAAVVGLAGPAHAAPPSVTAYGYAFTTLVSQDDAVYAYVDGYDYGHRSAGVVEVFTDTAECSLAEDGSPASFAGDGTGSASMTGSLVVECYDQATERAATAVVTVDLAWTATADPVTHRFHSRQLGCTAVRSTAPALAEGTVHVSAPELGLDVTLVATPDRPAELAEQRDRCTQTGRP